MQADTHPTHPTNPTRLFGQRIDQSMQSQAQRTQLYQLINYYRSNFPFEFFKHFICGQPQNVYQTQLYHVQQLTSLSFFIKHTFLKANAPKIQQLAQFIRNKLNPAYCLITRQKKGDLRFFYAIVLFKSPKGILLDEIRYPAQHSHYAHVIWREDRLVADITAKGSDGHFSFNKSKHTIPNLAKQQLLNYLNYQQEQQEDEQEF